MSRTQIGGAGPPIRYSCNAVAVVGLPRWRGRTDLSARSEAGQVRARLAAKR